MSILIERVLTDAFLNLANLSVDLKQVGLGLYKESSRNFELISAHKLHRSMIEVDYESFKFTDNFSIGMHRHFGAGNLWIILKDGILVGYFIFNRFIINCAV